MLSLLLVSARKLTHTKSQLGDFGLATNLSLFFFRDVSVFLLCPTKISFFLVGKEYLGVKNLIHPLIKSTSNTLRTAQLLASASFSVQNPPLCFMLVFASEAH